MSLKVATNIASLNTQRWLGVANAGMNKSLERLSSGYKINKAADDAAGIAIALKLHVKAASETKAIDNGNQAIAMLQAAEGGIEQIANILTRLKELATAAASSNTSSTDRAKLETERSDLHLEIDKIAQSTKYGDVSLLMGRNTLTGAGASLTTTSYGVQEIDLTNAYSTTGNFTLTITSAGGNMTLTMQNGSGTTQVLSKTTPTVSANVVGDFSAIGVKVTVNSGISQIAANGFTITAGSSQFTYQLGDENNATYDRITAGFAKFKISGSASGDVLYDLLSVDISTQTNAQTYIASVDTAVGSLNTERGKLGAAQNAIGYHVANLTTLYENTKAAESTIKDADFAKEMADFTKFQITTQAGVAMLSQANQLPQLILSLLK